MAYLIGVPSDDVENVARLIGLKTVVNEFAAYEQLGVLVENGEISARAEAIGEEIDGPQIVIFVPGKHF